MYNEAIETLKNHVNDLKDELKEAVKNAGDMPPAALSAVIFSYQNRINEVSDALLTLNSISDDEPVDNDRDIDPVCNLKDYEEAKATNDPR